jgi:hypothetical protein
MVLLSWRNAAEMSLRSCSRFRFEMAIGRAPFPCGSNRLQNSTLSNVRYCGLATMSMTP